MVEITPSVGTIDKYIGSAEAAIRKGLSTTPTAPAGATPAQATNAQAQGLAITDTISLADRADSMLAIYGSNARFQSNVQALKDNLSARVLGSIGSGAASFTQAASSTTNQARTLENGTTRNTEVTIAARTIEQTAAKNNNGVGVQRSFSETIIRESGGNLKAGQAYADTVRQEKTTAVTSADAAKGTLTQAFKIESVVTSSADGNTVFENRDRTIVYSLTKDGNYQKSLREVLTSITKNAAGAVVASGQTLTSETSVLNAVSGSLRVTRTGESVTASDVNGQTLVSARSAVTTTTVADTSSGTNPTAGAVTVSEVSRASSVLSRNDGTVDTSSTSQRNSTFNGTGTTVTSASTTVAAQGSWLKADGTIGGGSAERTASFTVAQAAGAQVLNRSNATVAVSNVGVRANGVIDVQAYNVGVKTATSKGKLSAPALSVTGTTVQTQIAAGTQNAGAAATRGPSYLLANGVLTLQAATDRVTGPKITLDVANRKLQATGRIAAAGASVDGIAGMLQAYNSKGTAPLSVTRDQNDTLTAVAKNPTSTRTAQTAIQAYQSNFSLGTVTNGVRGFTPVTSLVKLA